MYKNSDINELLFYVISLSNLLRRVRKDCFSLAVLPGLFPENPIKEALYIAKTIKSPSLIVTGFHVEVADKCSGFTDEIKNDCGFELIIQDGIKGDVHHTLDQISWLIKQIKEKNIKALVLLSQSYHLPRAFATLVQSFENNDCEFIPIIPISHAINPFETLSWNHSRGDIEDNSPQIKLFEGEPDRLTKYSEGKSPDVADIRKIREYGNWLKEHLSEFLT